MAVDPAIMATIEKLYAAAADESLWPQVMQDFLDLTDSVGATFCAIDGADVPSFSSFASLNFESRFTDEYLAGMMRHDPTVQYIVANPQQRLIHDSQFISEAEKDKLFYYDWHHSFSDTRHRLAGMASLGDKLTSGITVHRTRQQGDYHQSHVERFAFLLPHLERAVAVAFRLGSFGAMQQVSFDLLDASPQGIIVLDEGGRVMFANRAAREIVEAQDGVMLCPDGPMLRNPTDNNRLNVLIGRALGIGAGEAAEPAGVMLALRPSGKRAYSLLVSPLGGRRGLLTGARPAVCLVIADPERSPAPSHDTLRRLYGLTPAEVRLALKLAAGMSLQAAAEELTITYATARTQLAVIFRKTSTSRQAELVRLLHCGVPVL